MFGRNKQPTPPPASVPSGTFNPRRPVVPTPCPQSPTRSVPFVYDPDNRPAAECKINLLKQDTSHINLVKSADAATAALAGVNLAGLKAEVIVLLDSSGSMDSLYRKGIVQELLVRTLGWSLNVDADGEIPVIAYGRHVASPVTITTENYRQAPSLVPFQSGLTPMADAMEAALELAQQSDKLTIIFNLTDGNPNDKKAMDAAVIRSSAQPVFLKNLAVAPVSYLEDLDDMPSLWEIRMDAQNKPVLNPDESLILDKNPAGQRFVDNVDSQSVDPYGDSPEVFAAKMTEELGTLIEVFGRTGILTGVPGVSQTI